MGLLMDRRYCGGRAGLPSRFADISTDCVSFCYSVCREYLPSCTWVQSRRIVLQSLIQHLLCNIW